MATNSPLSLSLILFLACIFGTTIVYVASMSFIESSCKVTTYPTVCVQSLSVHANTIQHNPTQLVQTALNVSLTRAKSLNSFVVKLTKSKGLKSREYEVLKDCLDEMGDTVDRISKSMDELKYLGKGKNGDFSWHMSNIETWVSAALTDESTCLDGFSDLGLTGRIKASVKAEVTSVAQVTSNALALVNHLADN